MDEYVWIDDRLIPLEEARISPLDRGYLYGDGLFETMRSYGGVVHLLRRHLERLRNGGEVLRLRIPSDEFLRSAIYAVLNGNRASEARIRLTISRGVDPDGPPTIFIYHKPLLQSGDGKESNNGERKEAEDALSILATRRNVPEIFPRVKSLNYLSEILAQDELRREGRREGILLTSEGYVAEGTVSNLFCAIGGELLTPPVELGILPGITRGRIIELALKEGITVRQRPFMLQEFLEADEIFYSNSVREVVSVGSVDGRQIGEGRIGSMTQRMRDLYRAELPDENL